MTAPACSYPPAWAVSLKPPLNAPITSRRSAGLSAGPAAWPWHGGPGSRLPQCSTNRTAPPNRAAVIRWPSGSAKWRTVTSAGAGVRACGARDTGPARPTSAGLVAAVSPAMAAQPAAQAVTAIASSAGQAAAATAERLITHGTERLIMGLLVRPIWRRGSSAVFAGHVTNAGTLQFLAWKLQAGKPGCPGSRRRASGSRSSRRPPPRAPRPASPAGRTRRRQRRARRPRRPRRPAIR